MGQKYSVPDTLPPPRGMILERHPSMPGPASRMHQGGRLLIGYWNGGFRSGGEPEALAKWLDLLPDPHDFIDETWHTDERQLVANLLDLGNTLAQWRGYSFCRCCKAAGSERSGNGTKCLTFDGTWGWPEGFAHYVRDHGVRPPQEFIDHLLAVPGGLLNEMTLHAANKDAIQAKWSPLADDPSNCPDKGHACKHEDRGLGQFYCEKKLGTHGSSGAYSCLWAMDNSRNAYTTERERHAEAIAPFIKISWERDE